MKSAILACVALAFTGGALTGCDSAPKNQAHLPGDTGDLRGKELARDESGTRQKLPVAGVGTAAVFGQDSSAPLPSSCAELASGVCRRLEACAPFLLEAYYGKRATCEGLFDAVCSRVAERGQALDLESCGSSLTTCGSFVEARGVPAACFVPRGGVELDDACQTDLDCAAGACQRTKGQDAGVCVVPVKEGASCLAARCGNGLRCAGPEMVCVRPGADGAACASPFECESGWLCSAAGVCAKAQLGDACVEGITPCDSGHGQTCLLDACVELKWADEANSCLKGTVECAGTERCVVRQSRNLERVAECRPGVGSGAACNADNPCLEPLACRGGTCEP